MKLVIRMLLTLGIIGLVSGGLLSQISIWAAPLIEANKIEETRKAIINVQPNGISTELIENAGFEIYKVFAENKDLEGYAMVYEGNGFQGKVRVMIGLKPDLNNITKIEIIEQVETPGLGTKVTEDPYKSQFENLVTIPKIEWVKGVAPSKPNEIQAITGATITSKAVVAIINEGLAKVRELKEKGRL